MPLFNDKFLGAAKFGSGIFGYNIINSELEKRKAERGLSALEKNPIKPFGVDPVLQSYYSQALEETRNPRGYSSAERFNFNQGLARQNNTLYNNAVGLSGGNLSRAVRGSLNTAGFNAQNQFAANDAGIRRNNRQSAFSRLGFATGQMQGISNMNVNANIQAQNQYGAAIAQQKRNYNQALMAPVNLALTAGGYMLGGPMGGQLGASLGNNLGGQYQQGQMSNFNGGQQGYYNTNQSPYGSQYNGYIG